MLSNVPENVRQSRKDDYNFLLPQTNYVYRHHFPKHKLIHSWNKLLFLVKSNAKPCKFQAELKSHFLAKYITKCTKQNCYSCIAIKPI